MKFVKPSQLDTSNPGTWPIYYKILAWVLIAAGVFFLFRQFLITPAKEQEMANTQKINQLEKQYKTLYQYALDLNQYKARSKELIDMLDDLLRYLPSESETAQLIDNVYKSASQSNINLNDFVPSTQSVKKDYYDIMPVMLNTTTHYQNFALFAEKLAHLARIMNIADFSLEIGKKMRDGKKVDNDLLSVSAQLQTYIYNQDIEALRAGKLPENINKRRK